MIPPPSNDWMRTFTPGVERRTAAASSRRVRPQLTEASRKELERTNFGLSPFTAYPTGRSSPLTWRDPADSLGARIAAPEIAGRQRPDHPAPPARIRWQSTRETAGRVRQIVNAVSAALPIERDRIRADEWQLAADEAARAMWIQQDEAAFRAFEAFELASKNADRVWERNTEGGRGSIIADDGDDEDEVSLVDVRAAVTGITRPPKEGVQEWTSWQTAARVTALGEYTENENDAVETRVRRRVEWWRSASLEDRQRVVRTYARAQFNAAFGVHGVSWTDEWIPLVTGSTAIEAGRKLLARERGLLAAAGVREARADEELVAVGQAMAAAYGSAYAASMAARPIGLRSAFVLIWERTPPFTILSADSQSRMTLSNRELALVALAGGLWPDDAMGDLSPAAVVKREESTIERQRARCERHLRELGGRRMDVASSSTIGIALTSANDGEEAEIWLEAVVERPVRRRDARFVG